MPNHIWLGLIEHNGSGESDSGDCGNGGGGGGRDANDK